MYKAVKSIMTWKYGHESYEKSNSNCAHWLDRIYHSHVRCTTPNAVNVHFTITPSMWYAHNKMRLHIGYMQKTLRV